MPEIEAEKPAQDYEMYKVKEADSLWKIAYEKVLPPHSNASVGRCAENILENNDGKFSGKEWVKIPVPCDPQDGPEMEKQKSEATLNRAARDLASDFRRSADTLDAAWNLSEELVPRLGSLSTPRREYNYLISKIYDQMEREPFLAGVRVGAEGWNKNTNTWNNVFVADRDYPKSPPARIVQPDNTIDDIVQDRFDQLRRMGRHVDYEAMKSRFMDLNNLESNMDLNYMRGKPVKLPY